MPSSEQIRKAAERRQQRNAAREANAAQAATESAKLAELSEQQAAAKAEGATSTQLAVKKPNPVSKADRKAKINAEQERRHLDRLARVRAERDTEAHARAMTRLREEAARGDVNLMPAIMEAVGAYATIGEMCNALRAVYGEYREPLAV